MRIPSQINEDRNKTSLGCVMLGLTTINPAWTDIIAKIDDADLYVVGSEYGKENQCHMTLLYGLHLDAGVRKSVIDYYKTNFWLPKIIGVSVSLFEKDEYDVLKYDIELTDELAGMNKQLQDSYKFTNSYPDYHPHVTIAYLKKGTGQKYLDQIAVPQEFTVKSYMWSEDVYQFILHKTILGPVVVCRNKADNKLVMFNDETYEISQPTNEGFKRITPLRKLL